MNRKNKQKKLIALASLIVLLGVTILTTFSSEDLQGARRNKRSVNIPSDPFMAISPSMPAPPASSGPGPMNASNTGSTLNCENDELQTITIHANNSTTDKTFEKMFNEIFDSGNGLNDLIEIALKDALPNVSTVSVNIEADHTNYSTNGEEGTLTISNSYNANNGFTQNVNVIAEDEGIIANATVQLTDNSRFHARFFLSNPVLKFNVSANLKGNFSYSSATIPGFYTQLARSAAYQNVLSDSIHVTFNEFTSDLTTTDVSRLIGNTHVDDPILTNTVNSIAASHPIHLTSNTSTINNLMNVGVINNSTATTLSANIKRIAQIASIFVAQQSIADGMDHSFIPELIFASNGKVHVRACSTQSHNSFDATAMTLPYVLNGIKHN